VSNLNHVDNEKPSCSSVNGTAAVVEEQLVVDCVVGPRFSSVQCASMEEEEDDDDDDIMTQSQDEEILLDLSDKAIMMICTDLFVDQINQFSSRHPQQ